MRDWRIGWAMSKACTCRLYPRDVAVQKRLEGFYRNNVFNTYLPLWRGLSLTLIALKSGLASGDSAQQSCIVFNRHSSHSSISIILGLNGFVGWIGYLTFLIISGKSQQEKETKSELMSSNLAYLRLIVRILNISIRS